MTKKLPDGERWLEIYHDRMMNERLNAMNRMDKSSDWAIALTGIIIAGTLATLDKGDICQCIPIAGGFLLVNSLLIEMRRFRYFKKWSYILTLIEKTKLHDKEGGLSKLLPIIEKYDFDNIGNQYLTRLYATTRRFYRVYCIPFLLIFILGLAISLYITHNQLFVLIYSLSLFITIILTIIGKYKIAEMTTEE